MSSPKPTSYHEQTLFALVESTIDYPGLGAGRKSQNFVLHSKVKVMLLKASIGMT